MVAGLAVALGCGRAEAPPEPPSVILITADTLQLHKSYLLYQYPQGAAGTRTS